MPALKKHIPKLSRHASGHAFVKIGGRQVWLGRYGEPLAQEKYDRFIAEWLAGGRQLPAPADAGAEPVSVTALALKYWEWAKARYTAGEVSTIKSTLRVLRSLYGSTTAVEFGPRKLRAVRQAMVDKGWSRSHINRQCSRVRSLFKWGAAHEMIPAAVYHQLAAVEPLRKGEGKERPRVRPAPRNLVRAARSRLPLQLRALIDLQLLTGARADELLRLRPTDLDTRGTVWSYAPAEHKTAHHDRRRVIYFGPRAQRVLAVLMPPGRPVSGFLFDPRVAERQRHSRARVHRRPNQKPNDRKTGRTVGERYTTASYRRAIERACDKASPPPAGLNAEGLKAWRKSHRWHPHQLRHNAATFLRRQFGIDVARVILGHSSPTTTQIYAELDQAKAVEAMTRVG